MWLLFVLSPVIMLCSLAFYIAGNKVIDFSTRIGLIRNKREFCDLDIKHSSTGAGYLSVDMSHVEIKPLCQAYVSKA